MANKKISGLPAATVPLNAGDILEIVQGGVNKQVAKSDVATGGGGDALTTNPLSQFAATTSAQFAATISDETGTGFAVFSDSPALTGTPTGPTAAVGTNTTQLATTEFVNQNRSQGLAFSDEVTPITAAPDKLTFHWPYTTTFLEIWIELKTAQSSGSIFTVDVHKNGTTILSTKLTIDNTEETSLTAVTAPVISVSAVTKGDRITIDVDQVGNGTAVGGKIWFRG